MKIEIGEKWLITSDKYQFILQEKGIAKEGKNAGQAVLKNTTFHPKIEQLISSLILKEVRASDVKSLEEMRSEIERVSQQCQKAFSELTSENLSAEPA
jgi:hypothetical protein